jgi:uncharacterized membrane protein
MVPLLILILALVLVVFPIWAIVSILSLQRRNEQLERRTVLMQANLERLHEAVRGPVTAAAAAPVFTPAPVVPSVPVAPPILTVPDMPPPVVNTPPPPVMPVGPAPIAVSKEAAPPMAAAPSPGAGTPGETVPVRARFDGEQFTGTKLLAWTGGAAAFLGAAFFIKYSFEHDLIPPALRVAMGYVFALALIGGGLRIPRPRYAPTAQTFCATGIVCLYAVTFACSTIYSFAAFTPIRTFLVMAVITAAAFVLAVRLGAQVVAVLGMLGGFLTPVLLSTGRDNPFALFGYIALLDVGLVALALHQRWLFLVPLGAAGTVAMQIGWAAKFLNPAKTPTAMVVGLVFCAIFLAAHVIGQRLRRAGPQLLWPAIVLPCVAFVYALGFIGYRSIAAQPGLLFGFVFAADACLLTLAWLDEESPHAHLLGGLAVFALLATWTGARLTNDLLSWALGLYLVLGVVHTTFPLLLERHRPGATATWWGQLFPPLALGLMLLPMFKVEAVSFALWPCVLAVDLLAIGFAVFSGAIIAVVIALVLTLVAAALWLLQVPASLADESSLLLVVGGFAALFFAGGIMLARKMDGPETAAGGAGASRRLQVPALSALLPFTLLVLMTQRLPLADPSGVFGLALLLGLLCLGLTRALMVAWLPAWALGGIAAVEYAWHARHFTPGQVGTPFAWYIAFYALFVVFPFVFRSRFAGVTGPWAVAAVSGIVQFPLFYRLVERTWPNDFMGLIPALLVIAPLASMAAVHRLPETDPRARLNQIAWFGAVALFFITAIPPVQFDRQWITLSWALEGMALLWLFRRVAHPGLRAVGAALLVAAFVRLALNPAVLEYHARSNTPIFNWYLYTYGTVVVCLFAGAALLRPPDDRMGGMRVPPLLYSLGVVLAFLLVNIEIADFFSAPGSRVLTFQFSGNFARDMSYTIAWSLFALGLLLISIWKHTRAGRYAALALLGVAVLKLFLHDLQQLGALYRIGALFAVAIIAIVASLAYQRFQPGADSSTPRE